MSVGVGDVAGHAEVIFQILENEKETKRLKIKILEREQTALRNSCRFYRKRK